VDGAKVADNWNDLTDGTLDSPISKTEAGGDPPSVTESCGTTLSVWTGTYATGGSANSCCDDWSATTGTNGLFGRADATDSEWSFICTTTGCGVARPVYCIEQ
jgi:hypothetical protein